MVVKPNIWSQDKFGGFLQNTPEFFIFEAAKCLITGSEQHKHEIELQDNVFEAINYLNGLEFIINYELLFYLEN